MKKYYLSVISILALASFTASAFVIDWEKIRHWAGSGDNKAALVVQFDDGGEHKAYVWGYRWVDSNHQPSGEEVFRAISTECNDIYLFTQFTGWMGNTVCGIGYSKDNVIANHIEYSFATAMEDPNISFNWFSANTSLGQTSVPGWDTPEFCEEAIDQSKKTHILEHPIDAKAYGYACYDYDHWIKNNEETSMRWHAGWYKGYWSYWGGGADSGTLSYSGLGYTSRKLTDGSVDAWRYTYLDGTETGDDVDGYTGASTWYDLDYEHFETSGVKNEISDDSDKTSYAIYTLNGIRVSNDNLTPGIFIIVKDGKARKVKINN